MTDEELITQLRDGDHFEKVMSAPVAAARIEELVKELAELKGWKRYWSGEYDVVLAGRADEYDRAEAAEAALKEVMATVNAMSTLSSDR